MGSGGGGGGGGGVHKYIFVNLIISLKKFKVNILRKYIFFYIGWGAEGGTATGA